MGIGKSSEVHDLSKIVPSQTSKEYVYAKIKTIPDYLGITCGGRNERFLVAV